MAEVVAQGAGALGAAVQAHMRAAVRARREQGRGWVRTLWGAVETGGRRMRKSNRIRTEARASVADAARRGAGACVSTRHNS